MVVETKMAAISLVSREPSEKIAKNMARTARRQLEGRHLLFGEYLKRALSKMNLTSMDRWRLACFSHVFKLGIILNE